MEKIMLISGQNAPDRDRTGYRRLPFLRGSSGPGNDQERGDPGTGGVEVLCNAQ